MSGLDGIGLVEKGLKASPRLQVILISGFVSELNRAEQLRDKVACVIAKPFTLNEMRSSVKRVLG
jgi:DNA-binding NtrC family response regulator